MDIGIFLRHKDAEVVFAFMQDTVNFNCVEIDLVENKIVTAHDKTIRRPDINLAVKR